MKPKHSYPRPHALRQPQCQRLSGIIIGQHRQGHGIQSPEHIPHKKGNHERHPTLPQFTPPPTGLLDMASQKITRHEKEKGHRNTRNPALEKLLYPPNNAPPPVEPDREHEWLPPSRHTQSPCSQIDCLTGAEYVVSSYNVSFFENGGILVPFHINLYQSISKQNHPLYLGKLNSTSRNQPPLPRLQAPLLCLRFLSPFA